LAIDGAPKLSAFGYGLDINRDKIFIVGGSDGKVLHNETWEIDFKK
jgi:hypothetical protein